MEGLLVSMNITVGDHVKDQNGREYQLIQAIGSGGFGRVFLADRKEDGNKFAIKVFATDFNSQESKLSFQKEIQQSVCIHSGHVIEYYYAHNGNDYPELPPYIIMEYAEGGSLFDVLKSGKRFTELEIIDCFLQLCSGMRDVNSALIHRDIKPENILIIDGQLKVSDFGLSRLVDDCTKTRTFKGYGSIKYYAPEAWMNGKVSIQMDIYSMGIVFYEIATSKYPYEIKHNEPDEYKNAHLYNTINRKELERVGIRPGLVSVIMKMTAKALKDRFSDWDEIESAIKNTMDNKGDESVQQAVTMALLSRNEYDSMIEAEKAEKQKKRNEEQEYYKLQYSQLKNTAFETISEFIEMFNQKYPGNGFIFIEPENICQRRYSARIVCPEGNEIGIKVEVIQPNSFDQQVRDVFNRMVIRKYTPQCNKRDILLWAQIEDSKGIGFNLLLLKNDDIYGDWYCMENYNSGFGRSNRPSPFGFSLEELPEEINYIHATHIYTSEIKPFTKEKLLTYLSNHIS